MFKYIFILISSLLLISCKQNKTEKFICGDLTKDWISEKFIKEENKYRITHFLCLRRYKNDWGYFFLPESETDTIKDYYDSYAQMMKLSGKIWPVFGDSLICLFSDKKTIRWRIKYISEKELIVLDEFDNCIYFKADSSHCRTDKFLIDIEL